MKIYFDDKISCITDLNSLTKIVSKTNRSVKLLTVVVSALAVCVITHNYSFLCLYSICIPVPLTSTLSLN